MHRRDQLRYLACVYGVVADIGGNNLRSEADQIVAVGFVGIQIIRLITYTVYSFSGWFG
jgi:hypothetical protein